MNTLNGETLGVYVCMCDVAMSLLDRRVSFQIATYSDESKRANKRPNKADRHNHRWFRMVSVCLWCVLKRNCMQTKVIWKCINILVGFDNSVVLLKHNYNAQFTVKRNVSVNVDIQLNRNGNVCTANRQHQ